MEVVLFTNRAMEFNTLQTMLDNKGIHYITKSSNAPFLSFTKKAVMEVNGQKYGFHEAVDWVEEYKGEVN